MSRLTYNLAIVAGLGAMTAGVYLMRGLGPALFVGGALVLVLTVLGAFIGRRA